jgi:hypothetical protein
MNTNMEHEEIDMKIPTDGRRALGAAWIIPLALLGMPAYAQVCEQDDLQESLQYLRRLSLDLRGRVPDLAELESVVTNAGAIDPSIVRNIVRSDDSVAQARALHRDLLWANISDQRIADNNWSLTTIRRPAGQTGDPVYFINSGTRTRLFRGVVNAQCLDEPARFDASGRILTTQDATNANLRQEGWVLVRPYWNPTVQVKVCAFDAQDELQALDTRNRSVECQATASVVGCGCGPELRWCQSAPDRTAVTITTALGEQMLRFMDKIVREGQPYTRVLTGREVEVNGPISHYLRYQSASNGLGFVFATGDVNYTVPAIPFDQVNTWTSVQRDNSHAGVLTLPGYLLKFQSDRGRANRFYNAFLCQNFQAPPGGLPAADDPCNDEPDLTKRCGCKHCHLAVEPAAAYWGRWSEAGFAPLDAATYPSFRADCATAAGASNATCRRLYFTDPGHPDEEQYRGWLRSYVFADAARQANIDVGPRGIAQAAIDNGAFASCVTKQTAERLLARELTEDDADMLAELRAELESNNYDLRALIEAVVTRPEYVAAGHFDVRGGAR